MNDLLKSLKIEELLQKQLKKVRKNNKKKTNIFLNLQSKNESNFGSFGNYNSSLKIKNTTNNYLKNNKSSNKIFVIDSINNNEFVNSNFNLNNIAIKNHITNGSSHFSGYNKSYASRNVINHKKGVVVNKQSIVLKTNFEMSGRLNKKGLRPTSKQIGTHASSSLNYMDNHGSKDL